MEAGAAVACFSRALRPMRSSEGSTILSSGEVLFLSLTPHSFPYVTPTFAICHRNIFTSILFPLTQTHSSHMSHPILPIYYRDSFLRSCFLFFSHPTHASHMSHAHSSPYPTPAFFQTRASSPATSSSWGVQSMGWRWSCLRRSLGRSGCVSPTNQFSPYVTPHSPYITSPFLFALSYSARHLGTLELIVFQNPKALRSISTIAHSHVRGSFWLKEWRHCPLFSPQKWRTRDFLSFKTWRTLPFSAPKVVAPPSLF